MLTCCASALLLLLGALAPAQAPAAEAAEGSGSIAGTVTAAGSGAPVSGMTACAEELETQLGDDEHELEASGHCSTTNGEGAYTTPQLTEGTYLVYFFSANGGPNYARAFYGGATSVLMAEPVQVVGGPATGINATLSPGGMIEGTVQSASSSTGIEGVTVCATDAEGEEPVESCRTTGAGGRYAIAGLSTGSYRVRFYVESGAYLPQYYKGRSVFAEAEPVAVGAGRTLTGVDASLQTAALIRGRVTDSTTKAPLAGIEVCASEPVEGLFGRCATTGSSGEYSIGGLAAGAYVVEFLDGSSGFGYATQYYSGKSTLAEAQSVSVKAGKARTGVDAAMVPGGAIEGMVTDAGTKGALASVAVCASDPQGGLPERCATTGANGAYAITGLSSASYDVAFRSTGAYATQHWKDASTPEAVEPVSVSAGTATTGVDAALTRGAEIAGAVTEAGSQAALGGVEVCAVEKEDELPAACVLSGSGGEYVIGGLATGSYSVEFYSEAGRYATQYWEGKPSAVEATEARLSAGQVLSGVDAAMQPGGAIAGRVSSASSGQPVSGIEICALRSEADVRCTTTNLRGEYILGGLSSGSYNVEFGSSSLDYLTQYYSDAGRLSEAGPVAVEQGHTTAGVDASMQPGGDISGTVGDAGGAGPLAGIEVCAYSTNNGATGRCATTGEGGTYALSGLASGTYEVEFFSPSGSYLAQYYEGRAHLAEATAVTVTAPAVARDVNAAMQAPATIGGTVLAGATSAPLEGIAVTVLDSSGNSVASTVTGADGRYSISSLYPGSYKIEYSGNGYLTQYWNAKTSLGEAEEVAVASGQTRSGLDATMRTAGTLGGTVRAAAGKAAIEGARVAVLNPDGTEVGSATTGVGGAYSVPGLPAGRYRIRFSASGYLTQYYDGVAQLGEAEEVAVEAEGTTSAIDATMRTGGTIAGTVTSAQSGSAMAGVEVAIDEPSGSHVATTTTDGNGGYSVSGLVPGSYKVRFAASGYVTQYYDARSSLEEADEVAVEAESTRSGVDATMQSDGAISGIVTESSSGAPVAGAEVGVLDSNGSEIRAVATDEHGAYSVGELPPGSYEVRFSASGYVPQYYRDKAQLEEADPVEVKAEATTGHVDAALILPGTIAGRATSAKKKAIGGVTVSVLDASGQTIAVATTEAKGYYSVGGLAPGSYEVQFSDYGYLTQYWNAKATRAEAQPVSVSSEQTSGAINAVMQAPATITGTVTSRTTKTGIGGIEVTVYLQNGNPVTATDTEYQGNYTIAGLAAGTYKVGFSGYGYASQYYKSKATLQAAKPVVVKAGKAKAKVGAVMSPAGQSSALALLPAGGSASAPGAYPPRAPEPRGSARRSAVHAAAATVTASCPAMQVFGVRGSGETESDNSGYGHTIKSVIESIKQSIPDATSSAIDYQAIGVDWHNPSYYMYRYHDSVQSGIQELHRQISAFIAGPCGKTTYIYLVGYSQGADVAAETYQRALSSSEHARVQGIALLGDPHFNPYETKVNVGGYDGRHFGVLVAQGQAARSFSSSEEPLVHSYCNLTDGVCSFDLVNIGLCTLKKCDHLHYWNEALSGDTTYTEAAAQFLVSRWKTVGPVVQRVGPRRSVLVFGTGDPQEDPTGSGATNIVSALRRAGYAVTVSAQLPSNISSYGQVWWYGYRPTVDLPGGVENKLISYGRAGGSLYLTGEWNGCCESPDDDQAIENMFNSLVLTVGGVQFGPNIVAKMPINYSAIDHTALRPDRLTGFYGNFAGTLSDYNLASKNFLSTDGSGNGSIGVWDSSETIGRGQLAIVMDVNWAQNSYGEPSQVPGIVTNLAYFLSGAPTD